MVTLKELHNNLLKEELKRDYFLFTLNEALDTGNLQLAVAALKKIKNIIIPILPNFDSLKSALSDAESDAKKLVLVTDKKKASEIVAKLVTFYSKTWNFFSRDLPPLTELFLSEFINDEVPDDQTLDTFKSYLEMKNIKNDFSVENLRNSIIQAFRNDKSPWYKKLLSFVTRSSKYINSVPYLDIDKFADEFTRIKKQEFVNAIFEIANRIETATKPSTFTRAVVSSTPITSTTVTEPISPPPLPVPPPTPVPILDGDREVDEIITSLDNLVGIILDKYKTEPKIVGNILNLKKFIVNELLNGKKFDGIITELDKIAASP